MTLTQNQFKQAVTKGQYDLRMNPNTLPCQIDTSEVGTLVPGQAVEIVDSLYGTPKVIALTDITNKIFGVIPYIVKKTSFVAFDDIDIASEGSVIYMEAGAAIARGAQVQITLIGSKVVTAVNGNTIVGFAYDKAAADGDLIRVYLLPYVNSEISGTAADVAAIGVTAALTALVVAATSLTAPVVVATDVTASSIAADAVDAANPTGTEIDTVIDALNLEIETALDLKTDNADLVTMQGEIEAALDLKSDNADVETLRTEVEARLDVIEAKVDSYRTVLQAAGLMA